MPLKNTAEQYGLISKLFHWLIALLMIILLGLGGWMVDLSYYDPWSNKALSWHKALGIWAGLLALTKFAWTLLTPRPLAQASLSAFEKRASGSVHLYFLYAMLLIPASGYLISSSEGAAIEVFDWFSVPALFKVSDEMRDTAIDIHFYLAYITLALLVLHVGAALKHQFLDGKNTLKRML